MKLKYEIEFTDLAKGFAEKVGGLGAVEERVRGEIAELLEKGMPSIGSLMFHIVTMDDVDFFCSPKSDSVLKVDTATYEEYELDTGAFEGKIACIPIPDSED